MAYQLPPKSDGQSSRSLKAPNTLNKIYSAINSGINTSDPSGYFTAGDPNDNRLFVWGYDTGGNHAVVGAAYGMIHPYPTCTLVPIRVPGTNWSTVSMGNCTVVATKNDGTAWVWGHNGHGTLGIGGFGNTLSSPTQLPGTTWARLFGSCHNSFGIKCDGTLWGWGLGDHGQLGMGCKGNQTLASPTQIPGNNWKMVSGSRHHSTAVKCDGTLWTWGHGNYGALGICCVTCPILGTCCSPTCYDPLNWPQNNGFRPCCTDSSSIYYNLSSPVQVPGNNWICAKTIGTHSNVALKSDGTLWTWGHNAHGILGLGDNSDRYCPVQVPGSNWVDIGGGQARGHARKSDGTLWGWGHNPYGQLGTNDTSPRCSPIQTSCGGTNWTKIFCTIDAHHSAAIKSDGTLWTWGYNPYGELGNGTTGACYTPQNVGAATSNFWREVETTHHQTAAIACVPSNYTL